MAEAKSGAAIAIAAVPLIIIGGVLSSLLLVGAAGACSPVGGGATVNPTAIPDTSIAGYGREQLVNAAYIMQAGNALGLNVRDQTIGVMTAMGESGLRVLDNGDTAGPDSRGLFQQRANGSWGSYEDRMNPSISATNFFTAMIREAPDRESLEPTLVAHRVQGNANPDHYEKFWADAVQVVDKLSSAEAGADSRPAAECSTLAGQVNASGWAAPAQGPITSGYGMRQDPISDTWRLHGGTDLTAGGCDGPIWAAHDGVVTRRGFDSAGNGTIVIDHDGTVQTRYLHMDDAGMLVQVGDQVSAGQQIARTGSSGESTGCHLHFVVSVDGETVNPEDFMAQAGITLG
ncbi:MAG: M23 family metallopeptidase [Rhodoglobus sp.]